MQDGILVCLFQIAQSSDLHQPLLGKVMRVLLRMLALSQSKTVYENVFATQRSIVSKVRFELVLIS